MSDHADGPTTLQRASSGRLGRLSWRVLLAEDVRAGGLPGLLTVAALVAAYVGEWFVGGPAALGVSREALSNGRWWVLLTHPVTHAGHWHLWMNCGALLSMSLPVRLMLGRRSAGWLRYFALLIASAAAAAAAYLAIHADDGLPMVGASGAICGLWGLLVRSDLESRRLRPLASREVLLGLRDFSISNAVLFGLLFMLAQSQGAAGGLAWEAHLGGFLLGLLAAPLFVPDVRDEERSATS